MNRAPVWFIVVAAIALMWNLAGCFAFVSDLRITADEIAKLPEAQQALYKARPGWSVAATAVAVFAGALGCVGLLMKRRWALALLVASLVGVVVQDYSLFVQVDGAKLAGAAAVLLQGIVLFVAIGLVLLARKAITRGWLR